MFPLWSEWGTNGPKQRIMVVGYSEKEFTDKVPDRVWFRTEILNSLAGLEEPLHGWKTVHTQHMIVCDNLESAECTQCLEKNGKYCDPPTLELVKFIADDGKTWVWEITGEQQNSSVGNLELAVWKD